MTIADFTLFAKYICLEDLGEYGIGGADPDDFESIVDRYSQARELGRDARVYRLDWKAGALVDVTDDANRRVRDILRQRSIAPEYPDWMVKEGVA